MPRGWLAGVGLDSGWRRPEGRTHALAARLLGRPGLFQPRAVLGFFGDAPGLYDLAPMRDQLQEVIDFDLLNGPTVPRLTSPPMTSQRESGSSSTRGAALRSGRST